MLLLDTNVISELRAGKPLASSEVKHWAAAVPADMLYLSAISILELELGVLLMERKDPRQGQELRAWLKGLQLAFAGKILAFNEGTALLCAAMHVPNRRPERDAMIAATAREHRFTLVTRNTADFEATGVPLLNPWQTRT